MKRQHYDYFAPIIEWAEERNLFEKGRLTKQMLKSSEECLELQTAIESYENGNKGALEEIKDAIGDIYVTLVIATQMRVKNPYELFRKIELRENHPIIRFNYKLYTMEFKKFDFSIYACFISENAYNVDLKLAKYIEFLDFTAKSYNLELTECIELAYNTISMRKGKMIDGSFVKDK